MFHQLPRQVQQQTIVTSCDDTDDCNDDEASAAVDSLIDDDDADDTCTDRFVPSPQQQQQQPDDLFFDEDADDEDEAYVYKHLRSGMMETINVLQPLQKSEAPSNGDNDNDGRTFPSSKNPSQPQFKTQKLQVLKPRNTDAVLSCPYCFHIVCMDCQRHVTYKNQYRAMFVMNILVRWDLPLQYNQEHRCLEPYHMPVPEQPVVYHSAAANMISDVDTDTPSLSLPGPSTVTAAAAAAAMRAAGSKSSSGQHDHDTMDDNPTIYYTVCCANCQTTVAALDMSDEVYHFSGCLASA